MGTPSRPGTERHYLARSARLVLIVAFGVLLGILVTAGSKALSAVEEIHQREQAARADYLSRTEPLLRIHLKLDLYGETIQKSVVLTTGAQDLPAEARQLSAQIWSELRRYPAVRGPEERALVERLRTVLTEQDQFRSAMLTLHDAPRMKLLLGSEVLPSHLRVVAATGQIAFWDDSQFRLTDAAIVADFNRLRNRLRRLLVVLLSSGLVIAIGSVILIAAQDKEIRGRYQELTQSHEAQSRLSARLLDAQEQERRSISRELHDEVGQSLGALLVDVGRLAAALPPEDAAAQEELRKIRSLAESSVSAVRNIALLLRPSMLDDLGLVAAVEWQAREISRRSDVEVEVHADEIAPNLEEAQKMCIYRITQEALNNVARHASARHGTVTLASSRHRIAVTIRDDGKGFDPQRSRGLGILGMEERVRLLHGTFAVRSQPGGGTEISAELPLG